MKKANLKTKIKCAYDGGFVMPKLCFSCGEPAADKKWQITTTNFMRHRKYLITFPICDACAEAHRHYINILPINIVGAVVLAFSIFSLILADTNIPSVLFYLGGLIWLGIVAWYLISMNKNARIVEAKGSSQRAKDIKTAVYFKKIHLPKKKTDGEVIIFFRNKRFAKEFSRLNKGKEIKSDSN